MKQQTNLANQYLKNAKKAEAIWLKRQHIVKENDEISKAIIEKYSGEITKAVNFYEIHQLPPTWVLNEIKEGRVTEVPENIDLDKEYQKLYSEPIFKFLRFEKLIEDNSIRIDVIINSKEYGYVPVNRYICIPLEHLDNIDSFLDNCLKIRNSIYKK